MPDSEDFDPAEAVQGLRRQRAAQEAEKQRQLAEKEAEEKRRKAQEYLRCVELLRYADKELEKIRNPVVSEFVVTERWWTPEPGQISSRVDLLSFDYHKVASATPV